MPTPHPTPHTETTFIVFHDVHQKRWKKTKEATFDKATSYERIFVLRTSAGVFVKADHRDGHFK